MAAPEAFLIDVYDTMLTCDFTVFDRELSQVAGVPAADWEAGFEQVSGQVGSGVVTLSQTFAQILRLCGARPEPGLVARLVAREGELLREHSRLYDDVFPFLELLRSRGVKIALVSNCDENTRGMLAAAGVAALADVLSYSCEVGCLKPSPEIYQHALGQLGVPPGAAVFVDDQPAFCAAATGLGIAAIQMARGEPAGPPPPGVPVVGSFREIAAML